MQEIFQVDAFTDVAYAGNPAGVCLLAEAADEAWMQAVANEMNCAETAFLHPAEDGWHLRWFTPTTEVDLCGHATLASAHVLWNELSEAADRLTFHTASGALHATRRDDRIELDFPAEAPREAPAPDGLLDALGVTGPVFVGKNRMDWFVVLPTAADVRECTPDLGRIEALGGRGVIVTAKGEGDVDFVSRFFAPAAGVPEDPVTGSAHCALGPYWQHVLGKDALVGRQVSARGGTVWVTPTADRVRLGGHAVTTLQGALRF